MSTFLQRLQDPRPILLDGATGTELNRRGVDTAMPLWSARALIEAPDILKQIYLDYLTAGAEVITTNTFRTHRRSLAKAGLGDQAKPLTQKAVKIAQQAVQEHIQNEGHPAWVAGSISPLEDCYTPALVPPQEECLAEHAEIADYLAQAGVDLILIETFNTIREAQAAAQAARSTQIPFAVSFVLGTDDNLLSGESVPAAVEAIQEYNPIMIGINCTPTTTITGSLKNLKKHTDLSIYGYANVGHTDDIQGWENTEDVTPQQYAQLTQEWQTMNLRMFGGCCGTSPDHIRAVHHTLE